MRCVASSGGSAPYCVWYRLEAGCQSSACPPSTNSSTMYSSSLSSSCRNEKQRRVGCTDQLSSVTAVAMDGPSGAGATQDKHALRWHLDRHADLMLQRAGWILTSIISWQRTTFGCLICFMIATSRRTLSSAEVRTTRRPSRRNSFFLSSALLLNILMACEQAARDAEEGLPGREREEGAGVGWDRWS